MLTLNLSARTGIGMSANADIDGLSIMGDLLQSQGSNQGMPVGQLSGQIIVYGGGGNRAPLSIRSGDDQLGQPVWIRAIAPYAIAGNDSVDMGKPVDNTSFGAPRQPVAGGDPAPQGIQLPGQVDVRFGSSYGRQLTAVHAPSSTDPSNPYGA